MIDAKRTNPDWTAEDQAEYERKVREADERHFSSVQDSFEVTKTLKAKKDQAEFAAAKAVFAKHGVDIDDVAQALKDANDLIAELEAELAALKGKAE